MTISVEFLAVSIGLLITIASFLISRFREAENRGRLLQRIDQLEKTLEEMRSRTRAVESDIAGHDTDIVQVTTEMESIRAIVESMDKKLDKLMLSRNLT